VGAREVYRETARALGTLMAERGIGLVFGGGSVGLMGEIADAVLDAGGDVIGIMPAHLVAKEIQHKNLSELRIVSSMHERKAMMADLADGFIAMPGGFGTYDEFCEVVTWAQLGLHRKPCGILNTAGFYDALLEMFDHATDEGFIRSEHRAMLIVEDEPDALLNRMEEYHAPVLEKWITRSDV
jgi:uncharacterized protein (TIGR00730 family)